MYKKSAAGSLTLEAAVALPFYLFFFMALLSVMEMLHFSMSLDHQLSRIGKQVAVYASADALLEKPQAPEAEAEQSSQAAANGGSAAGEKIEGIAATVLADLYTDRMLDERLPEVYRRQMGLLGDLSLWRSNLLWQDDLVDLVAVYELQPGCNVFGIPRQLLVNRARTHAWTGYSINGSGASEEQERIVYVTENGTVYHLSRSCTHLDLSITPVSAEEAAAKRNASGAVYRPCEICGSRRAGAATYYITSEGDRYHTSLDCSGLKRTIYEVPVSQVGNKRACSRCGGTL
ncbi:MAG: hypothetical protein IJ600_00040 [Lachnospiraceae bacterium]|nr:hypothetical protein [Lachnospiraceae bacterium]